MGFDDWLTSARPGDQFVYAHGVLGLLPKSVRIVARKALEAASNGQVELVQRRVAHSAVPGSAGIFDYIAIKRSRKVKPWPFSLPPSQDGC